MDKEKMGYLKNNEEAETTFFFSDLKLGIFDNEVYNYQLEGKIELMKYNRLEMILDLNRQLIAN